MSEQIVVPALGESITEATVAKWLKNVGDSVEADEPIVELETDKVNLEVPSPVSGTVGDIKFKDGDTVEVGAVLGSVQTNGKVIKKEVKEISNEKKIEINADEVSNVISLEKEVKKPKKVEKETSIKIFEDDKQDEPLVLTNEIVENTEIETKKKNLIIYRPQ